MATKNYHYTECGLDSVYLVNGFEFVQTNDGKAVVIQDIDGLHRMVGERLVNDQKHLSGKEIRFLRHEMLLSQAGLARLLGVDEQTVARWEKGTGKKVPQMADATIRLLYSEHIGGNIKITELLERIADIEDEIDGKMKFQETDGGWDIAA